MFFCVWRWRNRVDVWREPVRVRERGLVLTILTPRGELVCVVGAMCVECVTGVPVRRD